MDWPLWEAIDHESARMEALEDQRAHDRGGWSAPAETGYDHVPSRYHGDVECMKIAKGDPVRFRDLYERTADSEVLYLHAMQIASEWRTQHTDENEPDPYWLRRLDEQAEGRQPTEQPPEITERVAFDG